MVIKILFISLILVIISLLMIIVYYYPIIAIEIFKIENFKFKLRKIAKNNNYYLQIRIFYIWYYIDASFDKYTPVKHINIFCLKYDMKDILKKKMWNDRWEIIKYYSEISSPKDEINI